MWLLAWLYLGFTDLLGTNLVNRDLGSREGEMIAVVFLELLARCSG